MQSFPVVRNGMRGVCGGLLLALIACDLPTELPRLQTRLLIPGERSAIAVADLLPDGVRVAGPEFEVVVAAQALGPRTLNEMCGAACSPLQGQLVPKPAFTDSLQQPLQLPADVRGGSLASGSVVVELSHDLGFDPLRPPGAAQPGTLLVTLRSGAQVLGQLTVTDPFPSGVVLRRTIPLQPGEVSPDLSAVILLVSPAGGTGANDRVRIETTAALRGTLRPDPLRVGVARVRVLNRPVSAAGAELDLSDVDDGVAARVRGGALVVLLANPFAVSGMLQLRLSAPGVSLVRELAVQPGETRQRVAFSEEEMRQLLGRTVTLQASGTVDGPQVTLTPHQELGVTTRLELLLEIGT